MLPFPLVPVKNTFVHFQIYTVIAPSRSKSAPPVLISCWTSSARAGKRRIKSTAAASIKRAKEIDDDAALRDFKAQAHQERWTTWAVRLLSRRCAFSWRWTRLARALSGKNLQPILRATLSTRAFMHVLQYGMRPLDFIQFHRASVLRSRGAMVEVWANDAVAQGTKVRNLILAVEHFLALARRCEIMLHLPNRCVFSLRWHPDFPIGALQSKALGECGLPPERQRLQCLRQDLQGDTVGQSGVLPGDVIDIIATAA